MKGALHRVVVTGIGLITPLGRSPDLFAQALLDGESAGAQISVFDASGLPTRIAAEVPKSLCSPNERDRKQAFLALAVDDALKHAQQKGADFASYYGRGGGLSLGIGLELFSMPDLVRLLPSGEIPKDANPQSFLQTPVEHCFRALRDITALDAAPLLHISACAASTDAIGTAFHLLRHGRRRWMIAGGADSMINPLGVAGFCKINAMTRRNHEPKKASRPFDAGRDGFLLGEGAGVLLLETLEDAKRRGAKIWAEILGYGNSFDAHGISEPHPEGEGACLAMRRALQDAKQRIEAVSHINTHGTSTPKNDSAETLAIRRLFGAHAENLTLNATKSMLGHLISASGAVEIIAQILCAQKGFLHPSINLEHPDPSCDLEYLKDGARPLRGDIFLKNSFAFGGQNAALVLRVIQA